MECSNKSENAGICLTNCEVCPFKGTRIGARGNISAPIVLIGEGPTVEEVRKKSIFEGPAVQLLRKTLPAGINLEDCFLINAIECMPKNKTPQSMQAAVRCCRERLLAEIKKHPRKLIITLGAAALWSITGDYNYKITKVRGQQINNDLAELGILATIHPAYVLRGGGKLKHLKDDLQEGFLLANGGSTKNYILPEFKVLTTVEEVSWLCTAIKNQKLVGADIETSGFSQFQDKILCIGIAWEPSIVYIVECRNNPALLLELRSAMEDPNVKWLWHNGKFDIKFLRELGIQARVDEDSMLLNYALDETSNANDLGSVAIQLLGCPDWKSELDKYLPKRGASYETLAIPVLHNYLAKDVSSMLQCFPILRKQVTEDKDCEKLYTETLIPASEMLYHVERRGFYTDAKWWEIQKERLSIEVTQLQEEINKIVGYAINPRSSQQVCHYAYKILRIRSREQSSDAKIVAKWPDIPFKFALQKYRKVAKALSTYVEGYAECIEPSDQRIHPTFKLHRTPTGRLACGDPNLQNIPRDPRLKGMYRAAPGYILIESDYSQAELRSLAVQSGDKALLKIFNTPGMSLHKEVAKFFYGPNYTPDQYVRAKAVNFGIVYGISAFSIAEEHGISKREAQLIIDKWFIRFPQAKSFIDKCRSTVVLGQTMVTIFGRKKRAKYPSREMLNNLQNEAANFPHQSTASDFTLKTAIRIQPIMASKWDAHIVDLVHDSIIIECPDKPEIIEAVSKYSATEMEATPRIFGITSVPFLVDIKTAYNWGNAIHDED